MNHKVPSIVDTLLANGGENIRRYFQAPQDGNGDKRIWNRISKGDQLTASKWIEKFKKSASEKILDHDEPWVTLVALYGLFGNQQDINNSQRLESINYLLSEDVFGKRHDRPVPPEFDHLEGVHIEVVLPEILQYREYVQKSIFIEGPYHFYKDRKQKLSEKLEKEKASFEGSTNLDTLISGKNNGRNIHLFIEAKFLSDISKDITYVPVRNQIARNIDCAIDLMTSGGKYLSGLEDFWFLLLTPGIFRTERYGGPRLSPIARFLPQRSRLFCYKMEDYLHPDFLRRDLPHWKDILDTQHWTLISKRIGWLTYEEIVSAVETKGTLEGEQLEDFMTFFHDRCLAM
jgi:hypothetical protein